MARKLFKLRKNKRFYYMPRFYQGTEQGNVYDIQSKFDIKNRELNYNDFKGQWSQARVDSRTRDNAGINHRILIIIAILVFIVLWILDFDLSIFSKR